MMRREPEKSGSFLFKKNILENFKIVIDKYISVIYNHIIPNNKDNNQEGEYTMTLYKYGMRLRGFSIGCQPMKNLYDRQDDTGKYSRRYHDIIRYTEKLGDDDLRNYELDYLGEEEE